MLVRPSFLAVRVLNSPLPCRSWHKQSDHGRESAELRDLPVRRDRAQLPVRGRAVAAQRSCHARCVTLFAFCFEYLFVLEPVRYEQPLAVTVGIITAASFCIAGTLALAAVIVRLRRDPVRLC